MSALNNLFTSSDVDKTLDAIKKTEINKTKTAIVESSSDLSEEYESAQDTDMTASQTEDTLNFIPARHELLDIATILISKIDNIPFIQLLTIEIIYGLRIAAIFVEECYTLQDCIEKFKSFLNNQHFTSDLNKKLMDDLATDEAIKSYAIKLNFKEVLVHLAPYLLRSFFIQYFDPDNDIQVIEAIMVDKTDKIISTTLSESALSNFLAFNQLIYLYYLSMNAVNISINQLQTNLNILAQDANLYQNTAMTHIRKIILDGYQCYIHHIFIQPVLLEDTEEKHKISAYLYQTFYFGALFVHFNYDLDRPNDKYTTLQSILMFNLKYPYIGSNNQYKISTAHLPIIEPCISDQMFDKLILGNAYTALNLKNTEKYAAIINIDANRYHASSVIAQLIMTDGFIKIKIQEAEEIMSSLAPFILLCINVCKQVYKNLDMPSLMGQQKFKAMIYVIDDKQVSRLKDQFGKFKERNHEKRIVEYNKTKEGNNIKIIIGCAVGYLSFITSIYLGYTMF